jgi:hypothetical protein
MGDDALNSNNPGTPLASAAGAWTRLSLLYKIIISFAGLITAGGVIFSALLLAINWEAKGIVEPIAKADVEQEMKKYEDKVRENLKTQIINEILKGDNLREEITHRFELSLAKKIGPMVEGRFILNSAKSDSAVDVFWREGHQTKLWVYVERFDNGDCILIQPPSKIKYPITKPGQYGPVDVGDLLRVQQDSLAPSGLQNSTVTTFKLNKGILDNVYQLTFGLGTVDKTGKDCESPRKSTLGSVEVEYFMATSPLVPVTWEDKKDTNKSLDTAPSDKKKDTP